MKKLRQIILWAVLAAIGALIVLSAIGALKGAETARDLFNSWPLIAFWLACLLLLATGFAAFRRLIVAPAGLAMHLGVVLIIAGAMWGSETAHELRKAWFDDPKVQSGSMTVMEGAGERNLSNNQGEVIATLPFGLYLKDFSIDYHPSKEKQWLLINVAPTLDDQGRMTQCQERIAWKDNEEFLVPHTNIRAKVLRYLEHARPAFEEGAKPHMAVTDAAGKGLADLPPEAGAEVTLKEPPVTVRIVKVFQNLKVVGTGAGRQVIDDVGHGENPGLQVRVSGKETVLWEGYVLPEQPGRVTPAPDASPLLLDYSLPGPTGAAADPASEMPAMELELTLGGRTVREWLMPAPGAGAARLPLAPLVAGSAEAHGMGRMMAPELYLVQPRGSVRSFKSDVIVFEENRRLGAAVIEVNHPLHWGGYHFYQNSYDARNEEYTVLRAVSDSGLDAVYLGLAILSIGAFWRFLGEAVWGWAKKRMLNAQC
ncbi:MAG: cytochrome c biogenesis protein ResB [Planctomycetota bacterium]|nr:cytochrome c biogenesis protein ResB [Planctomycetota bacterium]